MCVYYFRKLSCARHDNFVHEGLYVCDIVSIIHNVNHVLVINLPARIPVASLLKEENIKPSLPEEMCDLVKLSPKAAVAVEHDYAALRLFPLALASVVIP